MFTVHPIDRSLRRRKQAGFSLIEIIMVLVILGIVAGLAGIGMLQPIKSFMFARQTVNMFQDADYTMKRLREELIGCNDFSYSSQGGFYYNTMRQGLLPGDTRYWSISASGYLGLRPSFGALPNEEDYLLTGHGNNPGPTMVKAIGYDGTPWAPGETIDQQARVDILLVLKSPDDPAQAVTFETSVAFRNNHVPNMPVP